MGEDAVRNFVEANTRGSKVRGTVKEKTDGGIHVELDGVVGYLPKNELDSDVSSIDMIFGYISPGDPISAFVLGTESEFVRLTKIERPSLFIGDVTTVLVISEEEDGFSVKLPSGSLAKLEAAELGWSTVHVKKLREELKPGVEVETIVIEIGLQPKVSVRYLSANPLNKSTLEFENPRFELSILDAQMHWRNQLFMELRRCGYHAPISTPSEGAPQRLVLYWSEEGGDVPSILNVEEVADEVKPLLEAFPDGFVVASYDGPQVADEKFWDAVQLLFWITRGDPTSFYNERVKTWSEAHSDAPEIGVFHRLANMKEVEKIELTKDDLDRNIVFPVIHIKEFPS